MTSSKNALSLKLLVLTVLAPVHIALADNPDWMRWLADSTSLAALSIPGTHDTMANQADSASSFERPGYQGTQARCYLKSGIPSPTINSNTISGTTLSNRNTGLVSGWIETNVDRGGQDYRNFEMQEARPESCREACIAEAPHCKAFTYVKPGFNGYLARCYLKSGVPAPTPSAGCDSGVIDKP
ncbi:hypothetical protein CYFUS_008811 [Cystobacter fuscus]|uniref:Apple domain-containing protein n=1 Tax=Cystobacter fuscus TaxID=43 RepID=A0A250JIW8_9BACT|nr:PAN domain-containing protein [Cystobacter fuscus]ATB43331.1 hypothetical protein CYFUS_008811 [Cystobacter fuscus]